MRVNGTDLHVDGPAGSGRLLVLVHGAWTDHTTWAAVVEPLARSFRVARYDRRGHSRSPYGPGPSPRRRDEDDLIALVEALGGPAHLVGTSYGACVSLAVAGRRPDLVRGVVAHEPPLLGLLPDPEVDALFAGVQDQLARGDVEGGTRRFFEAVLGPGAWPKLPEPLRRAAMGNARTFADLREDPAWPDLDLAAVAPLRDRITVTRGDTSPAWLQELAELTAARIGCSMRVIAGAGHSPHLTRPAGLVAGVEEALAGAEVPQAA